MRIRILVATMIVAVSGAAVAQTAPANKKTTPKAATKPATKKAVPAKKAAPPPAEETSEAAVAAGGEHPLAASFRDFCKEWMGKLSERETRNISLIKWDSGSNWVQGTYTGFAPDYTCVVDGAGKNTIGKMTYLEVSYEKRGSSIEDAKSQAPHALETTEVTEIFRYEKGEWIY